VIDKVFLSAEAAVADVPSNVTILFGGFGLAGSPERLIRALSERPEVRGITGVSNNCGRDGTGVEMLLANRQIAKMLCTFPVYGKGGLFERQFNEGLVEVELMGQGTMIERIRAGGAGIPAFYTPTAAGTELGAGKETRTFNGRECVLEHAITADYAFVRARLADRLGNLVYDKTARNFNPAMATAARVTIAEVERVVEVGELDPEAIVTQGLYVQRVVATGPPEY